MKTIFLSLPMRDRTDKAIENTIESMKRIITAMYPNEDLIFVDNFNVKSHNYLGEDFGLVEDHAHNKALLYLGEAIQRMAFCDHIAYIECYKCDIYSYSGCEIEKSVARNYGLLPICIWDNDGSALVPDLKEKYEKMQKELSVKECCGECAPSRL